MNNQTRIEGTSAMKGSCIAGSRVVAFPGYSKNESPSCQLASVDMTGARPFSSLSEGVKLFGASALVTVAFFVCTVASMLF